MFRALGVEIETNGSTITLDPPEDLHAVDIAVPGDISSAAFFLVAGAIIPGSELTIKNVGVNPTRTAFWTFCATWVRTSPSRTSAMRPSRCAT